MPTPILIFVRDKSYVTKSISVSDNAQLRKAISIDRAQLAVEELYEILLGNYEELEAEILRISLAMHTRTPDDWEHSRQARTVVSRRIANYLSSAKAYIDQVPQILREAVREATPIRQSFKMHLSAAYDSTFGYRVCEALRNHTQHRSIPLHGFQPGWRRDKDTPEVRFLHYSNLLLDPKPLSSDRKFKRKVLEELLANGKPHELKKSMREYMLELGGVHLKLRESLAEDSKWAEGIISSTRTALIHNEGARENESITLGWRQNNGEWTQDVGLVTTLTERRKRLQGTTRRPPNLLRSRLTTE